MWQGLAQLRLAADSSMCTLARGKHGKHWYEYRYAASSLGTLSRDFLRKFAWAVGGAAGQKGGDSDDENAGSQHLERETDNIWCEDSYVTRPTTQSSVQRNKRTLDAALGTAAAAALVPTSPGDVTVPPMKVVWPSDLQMKGVDPLTDDERTSEGSQPDWVLDDDVGRRIRQSFLLSGADNALADVSDEVEAVRAEQQLCREGALSHAKVLSCHLCSNVDARAAGTATSAHTDNTDESKKRTSRNASPCDSSNDQNLAWLYVGSANLSAAAWGRPLNSPNKHDRNAAAGALDSAAVRHSDSICCCCTGYTCSDSLGWCEQGVNDLPWWGRAGQGAFHIANWELGVVLRPSNVEGQPPLQIDWPYRPETLRPYGAGERPALRSALREIRSK